METIKEYLTKSLTSYHAVQEMINILNENGFKELKESERWELEEDGSYYVCRDSSSLIAFKTKKGNGYNIVASHTDSPCLKIKSNKEMKVENYTKLNVEVYGGALYYTWLDKPLKIAGRVICKNKSKGVLESKLIESSSNLVIPSVAIHMNREVNMSLKLNQQVDLSPLCGINLTHNYLDSIIKKSLNDDNLEPLDYDLYLTNVTENFYVGENNELLCSPRIDNLTSAYASVISLIKSNPKKTSLAVLFDNEEVGSSTKQGAGGKFLIDTLKRINKGLNSENELEVELASSFMVSADNAHAVHLNHSELNDPTNKVLMGNGIVIKHHANQNYTTDAFSSSIFKEILKKGKIKYQDFFMKSDMRCGSTLGAISSTQVSIRSVDIGLGQLAMHSNMETVSVEDCKEMEKGLKFFYESDVSFVDYGKVKID